MKYNVQPNIINIPANEQQKFIGNADRYYAYEYDPSRMSSNSIIIHLSDAVEVYATLATENESTPTSN